MNRPLNKEQVKGLFEQEAVLMGTENCVPGRGAVWRGRRRACPQDGCQ